MKILLLRNQELLFAMLRSFFVQYYFTLVSVLSQPLQTPPSPIIPTAPLPSPLPCRAPLPSHPPIQVCSSPPHNDYLTAPLFNHYFDPYPLTQITLTYTIILLEPVCPSVRPSPARPSFRPPARPSVRPSVCMSVCMYVCLSVCMYTVCMSVCLSVGVTKLEVAILARLSREMSLTVHIV